MFERDDNLEDMFRSMARELGASVQRAIERVDVDELAESVGVDAERAREWAESAGSWLSAQAERLGDEVASRAAHAPTPARRDPLFGAAAHPLDLPTEEQGRALAALDSGRWTVEPGTEALAAHGEGPGPSGALGLVRELRVRDWVTAEGELTLAGRHALSRWLDASARG
jgi:hypothetical protein